MTDRLRLDALEIRAGERVLLRHAALDLQAGEIVGVTGPSGAGKSLLLRALLGLVPFRPGVVRAELTLEIGGERLRPWSLAPRARERLYRRLRGDVLGLIPQDAAAALDPLRSVGAQVAAAAALAGDRSGPHGWLERAGLEEPHVVARMRPHELSGGMARRVVIAAALARRSRFLLADEPATGLDPVVRAGLARTLRQIAAGGVGVVLVTHELRALAGLARRVVVLDGGEAVEVVEPAALQAGELQSAAGRRIARAAALIASGRVA